MLQVLKQQLSALEDAARQLEALRQENAELRAALQEQQQGHVEGHKKPQHCAMQSMDFEEVGFQVAVTQLLPSTGARPVTQLALNHPYSVLESNLCIELMFW